MGDDDKLATVASSIERLVSELQREKETNGKKTWMEMNPTLAVFILGLIVVVAQFVGQKFVQENIEDVVVPIQKQTEQKLGDMQIHYQTAEENDAKERRVLRQNDGDIAEHALESDRYNQDILKDISKKMKVPAREKPPELKEAEQRVRDVKRRGRE